MHFHAFSIDLNKSIVKENKTKFSTCSVFPLCMQYANKKIPGACSDAVPGLKSLKDGFRLHMPWT